MQLFIKLTGCLRQRHFNQARILPAEQEIPVSVSGLTFTIPQNYISYYGLISEYICELFPQIRAQQQQQVDKLFVIALMGSASQKQESIGLFP